jgi:hypothetical protein
MRTMSKLRIIFVITMQLVGFCAATIAADTTPVLDAVNVSFELLNRDGEIVRETDFQGQNVLLPFGFTHCLHICLLIAANMASALKLADAEAAGVFISVDTERDSAAIVDDYAHGFGDQMEAFALQFCHGLGVALHERPIVSRLVSLENRQEIKEGMVFALETYCPASDGFSAVRIEEEVVVTNDGCKLITLFPAEELPVANPY